MKKLSKRWVFCLALWGVAACGDTNNLKVPGTGGSGGAITPQASGGAGGSGSGGCLCTGGAGGSGGTVTTATIPDSSLGSGGMVPADAGLGTGGARGQDSGLGTGGISVHDDAPSDQTGAPTDVPIGLDAGTPDIRRFDAASEASSTAGTGGVGGGPGSGGTVGTGGSSSGTGGGTSCPNVIPCGGNMVGTWTVTSSCLTVTGQLDMLSSGLGCMFATVTGSLQVTGTWTANANGTYSDNTTTSGAEQLTLPASCLQVSGTITTCERISGVVQTLGYDSVSCRSAASGGCACSATARQTGGIGLVSLDPQTSGNYTTSGNVVTTDSETQYSYCVSGSKMTWTPQSTSPTTTGTVEFQKQ